MVLLRQIQELQMFQMHAHLYLFSLDCFRYPSSNPTSYFVVFLVVASLHIFFRQKQIPMYWVAKELHLSPLYSVDY